MTDIRRKLREMYSVNYASSVILGATFVLIGGIGTWGSFVATDFPDGGALILRGMFLSGFALVALGIHQYKLHQKTAYRYEWKSHDEL